MTRFARAKGSKASNEKLKEESTPWHVMKQQLEESSNKEKPIPEKTKTAKQLLEEHEQTHSPNNDWADFDIPKINKKVPKVKGSSKIEKSTGKEIKNRKLKTCYQTQVKNNADLVEDVSNKIKEKKRVPIKNDKLEKLNKIKRSESELDPSSNLTPALKKKKINETVENKILKQDDKKNTISKKHEEKSINEELKTKPTEKLSKRQKRNLKKKTQNAEARNTDSSKSVFDTEENDWNSNVKFGNNNKKTHKQSKPVNIGENNFNKDIQNRNNINLEKFDGIGRQKPNMKNHHLRKPKIKDNKEHKRRKPIQSSKLMINGIEIEVVMFDGFPVQKEDAERLTELKQKMILKGIPKSEIDAAMKLERRKAEKALVRVKKQVCFHCRKSGHNLSDCPELGREESATGICFKCGSTEHTHFECKVTKSDDYRYAKCFICKEQGHIAKQCPDNPKGLYPKGGACKICGDVTHLKKDCPDAAREKEETTITVKTITDSALESIDEEKKKIEPKMEPKQKIVKF